MSSMVLIFMVTSAKNWLEWCMLRVLMINRTVFLLVDSTLYFKYITIYARLDNKSNLENVLMSSVSIHACLPKQEVIILLFCLRRLTFCQQPQKVSKKGRSQTPRGLHSANRLRGFLKKGGLQLWMDNRYQVRDGLTRCAL